MLGNTKKCAKGLQQLYFFSRQFFFSRMNHDCLWIYRGSQVGVVFYICTSHLCDRMWAPDVGWVSVDLHLTWGFFSGYSGFPPSPQSTPCQKTSGLGAVLGIMHDRLAVAWGVFHDTHSVDPVWAAPFAIQPSGFQLRVISRTLLLLSRDITVKG